MARYVCEFGHKNADGSAKTHVSRRSCELAVQYDRKHGKPVSGQRRVLDFRGSGPAPGPGGPGMAPPGAAASPAPGAPAAPPVPKTPTERGFLGFRFHRATSINPQEVAAEATVSWELSESQSEKFWSTIYSGIFRVLNFGLDYLQVKPLPPSITEPDEGQKYLFRTTFRGVATNIVQKTFRAKTPEDADDVILGLGGFFTFVTTLGQVALHLAREVPKSPKIQKWRAEAERRRREGVGRRIWNWGGAETTETPALPPGPAGATA